MSEIEVKGEVSQITLELTCPICLQLFSEPVSLPCGHTYCFNCLQTMGEDLDQHNCPECQAEYQENTVLVKNVPMCSIVEDTISPANLCDSEDTDQNHQQDLVTAGESNGENAADGFQIGPSPSEHLLEQEKSHVKGKLAMEEPKFKLASQVTELSLKLEMAELVLRKEKEKEREVTTGNAQLRQKVSKLLMQMRDLSQGYSEQATRLIEEELGPSEASVRSRVTAALELTKQLRHAMLRAESLLTEEDETAFSDEVRSLQPHIGELMEKPVGEKQEDDLVEANLTQLCPQLEIMNAQLRESFGDIQRSLRNTLNPSEVTFDPETAHPNLVLSDNLKKVTFSTVKQPYPSSPQRFTSFFQVLSTQSFSEGDHCWEVELDGAPWIIGVCYRDKLARSGLPSALESSRSSWCLMWFNNLLTAFEQGSSVPLKKTTVSCRLEIKLSFKTHRLSFYNISPTSGKTHVYTFKANLTEPVHLAYRMMSGHPKAHVTIH